MRDTSTILQKLSKTKLDGDESKFLLGQIIRKEFDETTDESRAFMLLQLAYEKEVPQVEEMLNDYAIADFKWY